jgi:hypothetical protein
LQTSAPNTYFESVGKCIYCSAVGVKLTDEHIIPAALDGKVIFRKSSCEVCSKITGAFEGVVCRTNFGNFRTKNKFFTRRKKERPKEHFPMNAIKINGEKTVVNMPIHLWPAPLTMVALDMPTILSKKPFTGVPISKIYPYYTEDEIKNALDKCDLPDIDEVEFAKFDMVSFARMLAKIGHSYLTAFLGVDNFEPLVLDIMRGKMDFASHFIGGNLELSPPEPGQIHLIDVNCIVELGRPTLWVIGIKLFHDLKSPYYLVVAGYANPTKLKHAVAVEEHMKNTEFPQVMIGTPKIEPFRST